MISNVIIFIQNVSFIHPRVKDYNCIFFYNATYKSAFKNTTVIGNGRFQLHRHKINKNCMLYEYISVVYNLIKIPEIEIRKPGCLTQVQNFSEGRRYHI